jgi:hypothetical protein
MARRKGRDGNWRALAIIGALAAMVLVMAVTAFTLHKSSPLIAGRPQITTYQPASTGEAVVVPLRSERSIEGSPEPRARERLFVPLAPGELRGSTSAP